MTFLDAKEYLIQDIITYSSALQRQPGDDSSGSHEVQAISLTKTTRAAPAIRCAVDFLRP